MLRAKLKSCLKLFDRIFVHFIYNLLDKMLSVSDRIIASRKNQKAPPDLNFYLKFAYCLITVIRTRKTANSVISFATKVAGNFTLNFKSSVLSQKWFLIFWSMKTVNPNELVCQETSGKFKNYKIQNLSRQIEYEAFFLDEFEMWHTVLFLINRAFILTNLIFLDGI